jgi:hypothetical protein
MRRREFIAALGGAVTWPLILSDLHYIVGRLQEFYSADGIRIWLYARHPQLHGERAIDLINRRESERILMWRHTSDRTPNPGRCSIEWMNIHGHRTLRDACARLKSKSSTRPVEVIAPGQYPQLGPSKSSRLASARWQPY